MNNNIEYKAVNDFLIEKKEDGRFYISGYASVFGNVDSYGDVVVKGAFTETIKNDFNRIKLCENHDIKSVIGRCLVLKEDETGLYFDARMGRTSAAKDMILQIEDGEVNELSIGYIPIEYVDEVVEDGTSIRKLLKVRLIEISIVSRAANPLAVITSTQRKSEEVKDDIATSLKHLSDVDLQSVKEAVKTEENKRIVIKLMN